MLKNSLLGIVYLQYVLEIDLMNQNYFAICISSNNWNLSIIAYLNKYTEVISK